MIKNAYAAVTRHFLSARYKFSFAIQTDSKQHAGVSNPHQPPLAMAQFPPHLNSVHRWGLFSHILLYAARCPVTYVKRDLGSRRP